MFFKPTISPVTLVLFARAAVHARSVVSEATTLRLLENTVMTYTSSTQLRRGTKMGEKAFSHQSPPEFGLRMSEIKAENFP